MPSYMQSAMRLDRLSTYLAGGQYLRLLSCILLGASLHAQAPLSGPGPAASTTAATTLPVEKLDLGGVGLSLVLIPAGSFLMGNDDDRDAKPAHMIAIPKAFYLGQFEVTQAQWQAVMGAAHTATTTRNPQLPVDTVEWWEAQDFCRALSRKFPGKTFRLPSEAEWEYACRAGSSAKYSFGDGVTKLTDYAWYRRDDDKNPNPLVQGVADTHPVGQKKPNDWGLYDMHGNVWEWCQTAWSQFPYRADDGREDTPSTRVNSGPKDPRSLADARVIRGGSWHHGAKAATVFSRAASRPADHRYYYGFRVAMSLSAD
jgi:formylglycine-generating enzyme required for sulfatase activity